MKKHIQEMENNTDLWPWYWRAVGEKCYAFDVVEAFPMCESDPVPKPGSKLELSEDDNDGIVWVGENGTNMIINGYIAGIEQQNGDTICSFIAAAHAHLLINVSECDYCERYKEHLPNSNYCGQCGKKFE